MNAVRGEPDAGNILLVDAEARVEAGVFAHLTGWQFKGCVEDYGSFDGADYGGVDCG